MFLLATFALISMLASIGYYWLYHHKYPPLPYGVKTFPVEWPLLRHIRIFLRKTELHKVFTELGKHSLDNDGISVAYIGPVPFYYPEDVSTVLNTCLEKMFLYELVKPLFGTQLVAAEVPMWKKNRKILDLTFKQNVLDGYLDFFNKQGAKLVKSLEDVAGTGYINVTDIISESVLATVYHTSMGEPLNGEAINTKKLMTSLHKVYDVITLRFSKVWLLFNAIFNLSSYKREMDKALTFIFGISQKTVKTKKEQYLHDLNKKIELNSSAKIFRSTLDILLEKTVSRNGAVYTDTELQNLVDNVALAAFDTTLYSLLIILICIGSYPEVQEKIYKELQTHLDKATVTTKVNLTKLVYLEATIKEILRLYPSAFVVGREAVKDVKLRNITIPAGSSIIPHLWAANRHKSWGQDANVFKPERWLDPETLPRHPAAFASFSPGRRSCIGKNYAMMLLKTILVHIIQNYKIMADIKHLKLDLIITAKIKSGHLIRFEKR